MKTFFTGIIILFFSFSGFAQNASDTGSFKPNTNIEISINRFDDSKITIDGELDELVWKKISPLENFCEVTPGDNTKPAVPTEVFMFFDNYNLYIGIICYENDVSKIRKTLTDRDNMFNDDWAGIILDTYSESKQAYEFFVNPYGVQGDLIWTPGGEDANYDGIWYSASKIYKDRWTTEIAIPYKSIRFPDNEVQQWDFHIIRTRPRENREQYSWVPINRNDPTLFTHYGILKGIKNIKGGKNLEVLPFVVGSQAGSISDNSNADSKFNNEDVKGQVGLNLKYGITSNLTTDFALNPDFSQVESDAATLDVNNPYAIYYSEKRPFFIEGNSIFNTPISNVVYTRTINNPLYALKLTGKIGKYELGVISAYDKKSPFTLPFAEGSNFLLTDRKSISNIFRVKRSLKDDSYIGLLFTDRQVNKDNNQFLDVDGFNRVFGVDGNYRFFDNYSFTFQVLKSVNKEINYPGYSDTTLFANGKYTSALDGESFSGVGGDFQFIRSASHWNFNFEYNAIPPEVRFDNGFLQSNNSKRLSTNQSYMFYMEKGILNRIQPSIYGHVRHNYGNQLVEEFVEPQLYLQFKNQIAVNLMPFLVNNELYKGVYHEGVRRMNLNVTCNALDYLYGSFFAAFGKYIVRQDNPYVGFGYDLELSANVKLFNRIILENSYVYYELDKNYGGEKIYAGYIFRNKTTYNFNQNLSLRLITQYDSFNQIFNFNPLLSYKLNPFTIFYIGSAYDYAQLDNLMGLPKYVLTDRQYFLKLQYLWRL
jgi:hypothetical protein